MRAAMIGLGAALIHEFSWILYIFGAFLIFSGLKMLKSNDEENDFSKSSVLIWLKKKLRVTETIDSHDFFIKKAGPINPQNKVWWATPLFLTLVMVEITDLVFAVDSIPAIFAITSDGFIVFTSNIFAILGLRALYFALAAMIHRFEYLKYALAVVLVFIGIKIFLVNLSIKIPSALSLCITFGLLLGGVLFSLWKTRTVPLKLSSK